MILLTANLKSISIFFVNPDYWHISLKQNIASNDIDPKRV